jgi:hypothetical protein
VPGIDYTRNEISTIKQNERQRRARQQALQDQLASGLPEPTAEERRTSKDLVIYLYFTKKKKYSRMTQ